VAALLAAGADVNKVNRCGENTLFIASDHGDTEIVAALLAAGADVNKTTHGTTPLHIASGNGHTEMVAALLAAGADVNKADKDGWTPLFIASSNQRAESVKLIQSEIRWRRRSTATSLLMKIGQRDRPRRAESGFEQSSREAPTVDQRHAAALAHTLFHLRVSRSRGAEVVSNTGRRVIEYL
jgi:hypothetical protein